MKTKILVVDDQDTVRWAFEKALNKEGYKVFLAADGEEAVTVFRKESPHLVILDIRLPKADGLEILRLIKSEKPETQVIMITAHGDMQTTIEAMKTGAYDFIYKPLDIPHILGVIRKGEAAIKTRILASHSGDGIIREAEDFKIIGNSPVMQEIYKTIGKISNSNVTVLITGPSGTGKELIARATHLNSPRSSGPFVAVNCTAIPETLIESEFFGHAKGSFTGAIKDKTGKFELAHGGTLFLDEIGDIGLGVQAKLLRVLQEREIVPVGSNKSIKVDVRIISATNRKLSFLMDEANFRQDLLHRLKVVTIDIPPISERAEDIPLLVNHFIKRSSLASRDSVIMVSEGFMEELKARDWPGNVRELENAVESALALCRDNILLAEHLPPAQESPSKTQSPSDLSVAVRTMAAELLTRAPESGEGDIYEKVMDLVESELVAIAMERFSGNQVRAAGSLGISRHTLRAKLKKYGLDRE